MAVYKFGNHTVEDGADAFPEMLKTAHGNKVRPLCTCRNPGIEMYVAKIHDSFVIKRMPNTGGMHHVSCLSYEPPEELSGLGQVMGSAIQDNAEDGIALKFDFSLSKGSGRASPAQSGAESDTVKTDGNKLTLRGTLHYLWEQAGFSKWHPAMAGKRNWSVIRKYLLNAAADKSAKGSSLSDLLFVPEPFSADAKAEIAQRRTAKLARLFEKKDKGGQQLMIGVGEVKEFQPARFGRKLVIKHLPDFIFMLNEDVFKRIEKRFERELLLADAYDSSKLVAIFTFGINNAGLAYVEEFSMINVTENWIPFETPMDHDLLADLTNDHRHFNKGLRYNLPSTKPLACAVLTDTPNPVALYVIPASATDDYALAVDEMINESTMQHWVWRSGEILPLLPDKANNE